MTEKEHGSVAMGDSREEDGMPERIWAGDFDGQGFGHCVAGMQGGLYEEYVRADLALPAQTAEDGQCPRPCNDRPVDFSMRACIEAGECGCIAFPARPVQEPVAWLHPTANWSHVDWHQIRAHCMNDGPMPVPLYAAPQPAHGTSTTERVPAVNVVPPHIRAFLGKVQGVCMGVAMSGRGHPNPDGALMELFNEAQAILFPEEDQ